MHFAWVPLTADSVQVPKTGLKAPLVGEAVKVSTPVGEVEPPVEVTVPVHVLGEPTAIGLGEHETAIDVLYVIITDWKGRLWL